MGLIMSKADELKADIVTMTNQAREGFQALKDRRVGSLEDEGTPAHPSARHIEVINSIGEINRLNGKLGVKGTVGFEVLDPEGKETRENMKEQFKNALANGYTVDAQEKFQKVDNVINGREKLESRESLKGLSQKIIQDLNAAKKASGGDLSVYAQSEEKPLKYSDYAALDSEGKSGKSPAEIKKLVESFAKDEKAASKAVGYIPQPEPEVASPATTPSVGMGNSTRRLPSGRRN